MDAARIPGDFTEEREYVEENIDREPSSGPTAHPVSDSLNRSISSLREIYNTPLSIQEFEIPMAPQRMPKDGERNAPTFSNDKPEELPRYFRRMEEWFKDDNVEDEKLKKKKLVDYVDLGVSEEWIAFREYSDVTSTYEDFKAAIKNSYPSVAQAEKASLDRLRRKVSAHPIIEIQETEHVASLTRIMRAEIGKLTKVKPPLCANSDLVSLFLSRLDPEFRQVLFHNLRTKGPSKKAADATTSEAHDEDPFTIEEVFEMAAQTSRESKTPLGRFLTSGTVALSNGRARSAGPSAVEVKLEESSAKLLDSMDLQQKRSTQLQEKLLELIERQSQAFTKIVSQQTQNQPRAPYQSSGPSQPRPYGGDSSDSKCYYCGTFGHRIPDCKLVVEDESLKLIERGPDGRFRLANGQNIPYDPKRALRDFVLESAKRGIIPVKKIPGGIASTNLQEEELFNTFTLSSDRTTPAQGDMALKQLLENIVGRIGIDATKAALDTALQRSYVAADEDQNFD